MAYLTMKQMLESGVHFGHQTKRWNPKMKPYIFGARNGIYIIDLQQTVTLFKEAYDYVKSATASGGSVLFVGTKKQAQNSIEEEAKRCDMFYINHRWVGGFLTNFQTVKKSIARLNELENVDENAETTQMTKKELLMRERQRARLDKYLGGVKEMKKLPSVLFVVDSKKETIAIKEAQRLGIKVVAVVDSNCDPDGIDFVIPGNDDAIRAVKLFSNSVASACLEGKAVHEEKLQAATDKAEEAKAESARVAEAAKAAKIAAAKAVEAETARKLKEGTAAEPAKKTDAAPMADTAPKAEAKPKPKAEPTKKADAAPKAEAKPKAEPAKKAEAAPKAEAKPKAEPAKKADTAPAK
jgi:small subunit ribosomal protein S2